MDTMGSIPDATSIAEEPQSAPVAQLAQVLPEERLIDISEAPMSPEEEREEREEVKSLNAAALAIPDYEATGVGSPGKVATTVGAPGIVATPSPPINWNGILDHSASSFGAANAATSAYFNFAKTATAYSLEFAKRVTQGLVAVPAALADGAMSGAAPGSSDATIAQLAHSGISGFFDAISLVATGGIDLTSAIASVSLGAAGSGVEGIRRTLGSEALRSLAEFSKLVKREWNADDDSLPPGGIPAYSVIGVTKALSTWISIQIVTRRYQEDRMRRSMEEIDITKLKSDVAALKQSHQIHPAPPLQIAVAEREQTSTNHSQGDSNADVRITSSQRLSGSKGNVIGAEIGHKDGTSNRLPGSSLSDEPARPLTDAEAVHNLQRYSKLVLGVYGGVALYWLKGIPAAAQASLESGGVLSESNDIVFSAEDEFMDEDQAEFLDAASQMELDDEDDVHPKTTSPLLEKVHPSNYKLWDVITGTHDNDLFHHTADLEHGAAAEGIYTDERTTTTESSLNEKAKPSRPRYYVVTDHPRKTIILVFRGTLTVGDVAADLTCESVPFIFPDEVKANMAKQAPTTQSSATPSIFVDEKAEDLVHEGMYITAKEIAGIGKSVHRAVGTALAQNPGYSLDIAGHSLGAGVSCVIAMMWADPTTGLTTKASGLPAGRRMHAYCFAVPCVTNENLGRKVCSVITSHTYSYDLVCRLSLGSIQDIRNAIAWLCYQDKEAGHGPQTMNALMKRGFEYQSGRASESQMAITEQEFLVLRKVLEANMHNTHMLPPGKVLYSLLSENDLLPNSAEERAKYPPGTHRLFKMKPDNGALHDVFGQMVFSRNMLSSHMPNVYDDLLHSLS